MGEPVHYSGTQNDKNIRLFKKSVETTTKIKEYMKGFRI
jgi:hypothetical protein